jgi:ABC-type siderophore export system fused ATPase/permease subunit
MVLSIIYKYALTLHGSLLPFDVEMQSHVRILDISLGENAPKIHGVRLLKGITEDLAVVCIYFTFQCQPSVLFKLTFYFGSALTWTFPTKEVGAFPSKRP